MGKYNWTERQQLSIKPVPLSVQSFFHVKSVVMGYVLVPGCCLVAQMLQLSNGAADFRDRSIPHRGGAGTKCEGLVIL